MCNCKVDNNDKSTVVVALYICIAMLNIAFAAYFLENTIFVLSRAFAHFLKPHSEVFV